MAQNITLLGASYSAVPAVVLPKTGGGTARFDDASITTATASDVASGKIFLANDGTITTGTSSGGGGGVDMPTFTVTWDAEYTQILSVTCDKTYSEVYDYINAGKVVAIVREPDGEYTAELVAYFIDFDHFPSNSIKYFVYINTRELSYDIIYNSGGTLTAISPSSYYETLNVTANGTYAPSTDYSIINTVNVNVPSTTISPLSVTANGTYTAPSGTAYSPVTVNVSGGGGGASSWTKVAETSYQVNTTSTNAITVATWATGHSELWTSDKIVYVRVRDTAGKRAGYFYGTDNFFFNIYPKNNSATSETTDGIIRAIWRVSSDGNSGYVFRYGYGTTGYGVYSGPFYSDGRIAIRARYNGTYSLTINGTYKVEVYLLDPAGGVPIFT